MAAPLLEIKNLSVEFRTALGPLQARSTASTSPSTPATWSGIVGESGSGKSVAMLAVMGLLPWTAKITADRLSFQGEPLLGLSPRQRRRLIGKDMAMIFQEPMSSLNPCFTVEFQITEALRVHEGMRRKAGAQAGAGAARPGRHPVAAGPARRLPAPALRRHEPAGDDRHGDRLQPASS